MSKRDLELELEQMSRWYKLAWWQRDFKDPVHPWADGTIEGGHFLCRSCRIEDAITESGLCDLCESNIT